MPASGICPALTCREVRWPPIEMNVYRRPFLNPGEDRRPTLTWPRQIPIDGEPEEVHDIVAGYSDWICSSDIPKLFINADPVRFWSGRSAIFAEAGKINRK